jgi:hypothetical protein
MKAHVIFTIIKGIIEDEPEAFADRKKAEERADTIAKAWGYESAGHYHACLHGDRPAATDARNPMDYEMHWFEGVEVLGAPCVTALRSIIDMIEDAIDGKIRMGRMPNTARLLSTILDTARAALSKKEDMDGKDHG